VDLLPRPDGARRIGRVREERGAPPHHPIGALLLKHGYADGLICGTYGMYRLHLDFIESVLGRRPGVQHCYALNV
jgi:phosphotransacetylase